MELTMEQYGKYIKNAAPHLSAGAFLTTKSSGRVNTMTIGWGTFGFQWGMPTFEAMVRESRFSKAAMDSEETFTVTIPYGTDMRDALSYCGKISGRDEDKIEKCGLVLSEGRACPTPAVSCHGLVIECKTVMRLDMNSDNTAPEVLERWYKSGDLHTMYYGKVLAAYEI